MQLILFDFGFYAGQFRNLMVTWLRIFSHQQYTTSLTFGRLAYNDLIYTHQWLELSPATPMPWLPTRLATLSGDRKMGAWMNSVSSSLPAPATARFPSDARLLAAAIALFVRP
jgi:hypothetical protein